MAGEGRREITYRELLRFAAHDGRGHGAGTDHLQHRLPVQPALATQRQCLGKKAGSTGDHEIDHQLECARLLGRTDMEVLVAKAGQQRLQPRIQGGIARGHHGQCGALGKMIVARDRHPQVLQPGGLQRPGHLGRQRW